MSGRIALVTLIADPRYQTRRAIHVLQTADVLVVDKDASLYGLLPLPGAETVVVQSAEEAMRTLSEEAGRGRQVVRVVSPERALSVMGAEMHPLAARGHLVEVVPWVRPEDAARARFLVAPADKGSALSRENFVHLDTGAGLPALVKRLTAEWGSDVDAVLIDRRGLPLYGPAALGAFAYAGPEDVVDGVLVGVPRLARPPLEGRRVLLLRTQAQVGPLRFLLEDAGAVALEAPVLEMAAPDWRRVDPLLHGLERYRWVVFTSQNGVEAFFDRLRYLGRDIRSFDARIAAVGPETRRRLQDMGLLVDLVPEPGRSRQQGLLELFRAVKPVGQAILIATGERRAPALASGLRALGAVVDEAVVYRTRAALLAEWVEPELLSGSIDAVAFTSGSSARFLVRQLSEAGRRRLTSCCLVAIGPATRQVMEELRLPVAAEARSPGPGGIVEALSRCLSGAGSISR
jgi:uroporphyrinogen-III synthase